MANFKLLFCLIVFVVQFQGRQGCIEEERRSLLKYKAYFQSITNGSDADSILPSWVDDDPHSDCCLWYKVFCSNITHHVIALFLSNTREEKNIVPVITSPFNLSIFQPLKELLYLDLSENGFGQIQKEGMLQNAIYYNI